MAVKSPQQITRRREKGSMSVKMALRVAGGCGAPWTALLVSSLVVHLLISHHPVTADSNRLYHVSKLCVRERYHPLYKKIDGALITSENESDLDCVLTFQTDSILQRFMLRFEELALDCQDHLYVYDGAHAFGHYKADLSCRSTRAEIGTIFTQSNFLTLKYVTDKYSQPGDGFRLVITAFKDTPSIGCSHLKCLNTFCISKDLACDNVNHCGDNSDETSHAFCYSDETESTLVLGVDAHIFIGVVLAIFVVCLVCVVNLAICLCRREHSLSQQHRVALHGASTATLAHPASYAGGMAGTLTPQAARYATLPLDKMRPGEKVGLVGQGGPLGQAPPPYTASGNLFTPAQLPLTNGHATHGYGSTVAVTQHNGAAGQGGPLGQVVYYTSK